MRTRSTVTAAFALAAATILAVAACGSSVTGSAQPNSAAAVAASVETELSALVSELPTDLTVPTDLTLPTDLTFPTDFTVPSDISGLEDLTALNIPGYAGECISVSLAYLSVSFAPLATLAGGSGSYDAAELQKAFEDLKAQATIPPEIAPDFVALEELAQQASGATLSEAGALFESEQFTTASDNISAWLDANCSGG